MAKFKIPENAEDLHTFAPQLVGGTIRAISGPLSGTEFKVVEVKVQKAWTRLEGQVPKILTALSMVVWSGTIGITIFGPEFRNYEILSFKK